MGVNHPADTPSDTTQTTNSFKPLATADAPDFLEITRSVSTENLPQESIFVSHDPTPKLPRDDEWEKYYESEVITPVPKAKVQDEESQNAKRISHRATWWPLPGSSIVAANEKDEYRSNTKYS
jgi:hypothetical protein